MNQYVENIGVKINALYEIFNINLIYFLLKYIIIVYINVFIFLQLLLSSYHYQSNKCHYKENPIYNEFNKFIEEYNRNYTKSEYLKRYEIFSENLNYINYVNKQNKTYKLGINNFTDITHEEFKYLYLSYNLNTNKLNRTSNYNYINNIIPQSIDWRANNMVTNVKDQESMWKLLGF